MAGLLDALNTDEARLGLSLLAAGGYSPTPQSFGQRVQGALQSVEAQKRGAMQGKLMQSQIDENASQAQQRQQQIELARRRQAERDAMLGFGRPDAGQGGLLSPTPASASPGATAQSAPLSQPTPEQQAALSQVPPPPPQVQTKLEQLSQQFKIPLDALKFDVVFNDGKGLAEMVAKRGTPDMQVSNGYAYDKNQLGAGFMPSLTTSTTGQTSMTRIGPDGMPVVSAPEGALKTYGAYKDAEAGRKPIEVYNPETGRKEFRSELDVVRPQGAPAPMAGPAGNVQSPAYAGGSREGANAESVRMMESELQNPNLNPADRAGIQREIARMKQQTPAAFAAGPSAAEAAATKAAEARAVDTAKADVVRDTAKTGEVKKASMMIGQVDRALELLKSGPTGSGVGAALDAAGGLLGVSSKSADLASQLETLSGWLVANVPRMEGPQSNFDVENYRTMAGTVGNRAKPISTRIAAAEEVKRLQSKYANLNGGAAPKTSGATGDWGGKSKVMDSLPTANASNMGQRMRDTTTGKILRSNGMQWKEE